MRKKLPLLLITTFFSIGLMAQYYLRGEIKDEKGRLLPGVKINLHSKGRLPFYSGNTGAFGLPTTVRIDTISLWLEGFEPFKQAVNTTEYQVFTLKMLPATASLMKNRLASATKNLAAIDQLSMFSSFGESYSSIIDNTFIEANVYPETGFALNIDRASYSNIRRFINNGMNIPRDAVRIEEMLNYFSYKSQPQNNTPQFLCNTKVTNCPWNNQSQLCYINLQAPKLNLDSIPPSNLVFLIDVSGSMDKPNRLPLLQAGFKLLTSNLRAIDTISIVTYGGGVAVPLPPTGGNEKDKINQVIDSLYADGDTPGEGAIRTAYAVAKRAFIRNGNNRVIIATDGDFNVGQTNEKDLEDLIVFQRLSGIYLTCLGVGMGNYKDSKLETLAKKGNGNFAYLDNIYEAEKVLVTEFTKTLYSVANDAYASINFNPQIVKKYRLIGFDNKKEAMTDTSSQIEGGEVGSGHSLMAIFEIETENNTVSNANVASIHLQYIQAATKRIVKQQFQVPYAVEDIMQIEKPYRFSTAVAMFGSLVKESLFAKKYTFSDVIQLANSALEDNNFAQQEFLQLVQKADKIYNHRKKR